jgi:hypothetical protein
MYSNEVVEMEEKQRANEGANKSSRDDSNPFLEDPSPSQQQKDSQRMVSVSK